MTPPNVLAAPATVDPEHPWPGLYAYTEEQVSYFHGREAEIDELLRRVRQKTLTVLFGQSGLGKSSLLSAGLFPRLREAGLHPVPIRIVLGNAAPSPEEQTSTVLSGPGLHEPRTFWEAAGKNETPTFIEADSANAPVPVLVFDQFEELFTRGQETAVGREQVASFLRHLAAVVENRTWDASPSGRRLRILLALREDYLAHLESWREKMPSLLENRMRLIALDGHAALRAVTRPAGLRTDQPPLVTPGVSRQLVRFLATGRTPNITGKEDLSELTIDPALLSLILRELNARREQRGLVQITSELLQETGEVNGILREFYRRIVASEHPAVRQLLEDQLLTETGYRDNISIERAERFLVKSGGDAAAIERLVQRRLLRVEERLEQRRLELAHDVLCRVLTEARDKRHQEERVLAAEAQAAEHRGQLRRARLLYGALGLAGAAVLIASGLALFAIHNLHERQRLAVARKKAESLIAFMEGDLHEKLKPLGKVSLLGEVTNRINVYYDAVLAEEGRTSLHLAAKSHALTQQGDTEESSGQLDRALQDYQTARDIAEEARAQEPGNAGHSIAIAHCLRLMGDVLQKQNRREEALVALRRSQELYATLSRANAEDTALRGELAVSYERIGDLIFWQRDFDKALTAFEEEERIFKELQAREPAVPAWRFGLAKTVYRFGLVKRGKKEMAGALADYEACHDVFQRLVDEDPDNAEWQKELARSTTRIGGIYQDQKQIEAALNQFSIAVTIYEKIADRDPADADKQRDLATSEAFLGMSLNDQGKFDEALRAYDKSLRIREKLAAIDTKNLIASRDFALGLRNVGLVRRDRQEFQGAVQLFRRALPLFEEAARNDPKNADWQNNIAGTLFLIADCLWHLGAPAERTQALEDTRKGLAILAELVRQGRFTEDYLETRQDLQALESRLLEPKPDAAGK